MAARSDKGGSGDETDASSDETAVSGRVESRRSLRETHTETMVFELQGTVGQLKQAIASLDGRVAVSETRTDRVEQTANDIKALLERIAPKIEDLSGFVKYGVPGLATKSDIAALRLEIERRPTRRQSVLDIAWIVGTIITAATFGARALR